MRAVRWSVVVTRDNPFQRWPPTSNFFHILTFPSNAPCMFPNVVWCDLHLLDNFIVYTGSNFGCSQSVWSCYCCSNVLPTPMILKVKTNQLSSRATPQSELVLPECNDGAEQCIPETSLSKEIQVCVNGHWQTRHCPTG